MIGCRSLTIHRVESALLTESVERLAKPKRATHRAVSDILIASPDFGSAMGLKNGITRNTQTDRKIEESLTTPLQRGVKVIGSSD
jgi:hypothetical protein